MTITNKYVDWIIYHILKRQHKLTELHFEFSRSYYDNEQIYESFVRQYAAELREKVDKMLSDLSEEIGDKL